MKNLIEMKEGALVELKEAYDKLEGSIAECVKGQNDGLDADKIKALKKAVTNDLAKHNGIAAKVAYLGWGIDDGPTAVEKAIRALYVPGAKKVAYKADKNSGVITASISPALMKVDLVAMHETIGEGYFHSEEWFAALEKMTFIIANALNKELGGSIDFQYAIQEASKAFEFAPDANPTSNKSVVKALQYVVDAILYIPDKDKKGNEVNSIKVTSKNWAFIREAMTRKGGVGEIVMCNTARVAEYVAEVIYKLLRGEGHTMVTE